MILCDYSCGQEATYKFKNGKFCCGNNISKCPKIKEVIGKTIEQRVDEQMKDENLKVEENKEGKWVEVNGSI